MWLVSWWAPSRQMCGTSTTWLLALVWFKGWSRLVANYDWMQTSRHSGGKLQHGQQAEFRSSEAAVLWHVRTWICNLLIFTAYISLYVCLFPSFSHQSTRSMKLHITQLQSNAWDAQFFFSTRNQKYQKSRDAMPSRNLLLAPLHVLSNWMQKDGDWSAAKKN